MTDTLRKRIEAIRDEVTDMSIDHNSLAVEYMDTDNRQMADIERERARLALAIAKELHAALSECEDDVVHERDPNAQEAYLALFRKEGGL